MKFLHLSDLHLGKRVHGFSMLEDQAYILQQIIDCIAAEQPDGVLICGAAGLWQSAYGWQRGTLFAGL